MNSTPELMAGVVLANHLRPEQLAALEPVPADEVGDRDRLRARLDRDGYLFFKGILSRSLVLGFREFYFSSLTATGLLLEGTDPVAGIGGPGPVDSALLSSLLVDHLVKSPQYDALCTTPEIVGFFEWFLGGKTFLHRREIIRHKASGSDGTGAHHDLMFLRGGTKEVFSTWIPIGDVSLHGGGLAYLEGSKLAVERNEKAVAADAVEPPANPYSWRGLTELADAFEARWLTNAYEAGDMVVHSPYTIHASLRNLDDRGVMRLSTDIRYQLASEPIDPRWQNGWRPDDML